MKLTKEQKAEYDLAESKIEAIKKEVKLSEYIDKENKRTKTLDERIAEFVDNCGRKAYMRCIGRGRDGLRGQPVRAEIVIPRIYSN